MTNHNLSFTHYNAHKGSPGLIPSTVRDCVYEWANWNIPDNLLVMMGTITHPAEVSRFVNGFLQYKRDTDPTHNWAHPAFTFHTKIADCEEQALMKMVLVKHLWGDLVDVGVMVVTDLAQRGDHAVTIVASRTPADFGAGVRFMNNQDIAAFVTLDMWRSGYDVIPKYIVWSTGEVTVYGRRKSDD